MEIKGQSHDNAHATPSILVDFREIGAKSTMAAGRQALSKVAEVDRVTSAKRRVKRIRESSVIKFVSAL